jgi:AraC-like DNA-binding protein
MTVSALDIPFHQHVRRGIAGGCALFGAEGGWLAPVAVFDAPSGFGEGVWVPDVQTATVAVRLSGAPVVCHVPGLEGRRSAAGRTVAVQPKGAPNFSTCDGRIRFAQVYLSDVLIRRVVDAVAPSSFAGLRDDLWFVADDELETLASQYVARAAAERRPVSRLEMEARAILLMSHIVAYGQDRHRATVAQGGLAPWRERRATEYLRANLARDVALDELAETVGLSPFHLSRMFKRSTGLPPHAYLRRLRCERAKELLLATDTSIGDVAAAVGYETPQAFARMFRAETGTSPAAFRRERRA